MFACQSRIFLFSQRKDKWHKYFDEANEKDVEKRKMGKTTKLIWNMQLFESIFEFKFVKCRNDSLSMCVVVTTPRHPAEMGTAKAWILTLAVYWSQNFCSWNAIWYLSDIRNQTNKVKWERWNAIGDGLLRNEIARQVEDPKSKCTETNGKHL